QEGNQRATRYEQGRVQEVFEARVEGQRQAVALLFEGRQMTYAELNRRANQLARRLQKAGVGPEVPVGLCVERSFEMIIAMLAILKAGGAYVPLDSGYPKERLQFMLEDAGVRMVVTDGRGEQEEGRGTRERSSHAVICLEKET